MKYIIQICLIVLIPFALTGQSQFENPGFEEWEEVGTPYEEPLEWSSIKTGDHPASVNAPVVVGRSDDAHAGNYSLYLINKYIGLIDYVAAGNVTNGRIHVSPDLDPRKSVSFTDVNNSQWHTPLIYRPDSVVGWFKANPEPNDFPTVKVILHADSNSIPGDSLNWIARAYWQGQRGVTVNGWTRFSAPFDYYKTDTPEFILSILTSGNGYYSIEDSEAWFDDLELIYNESSVNELKPENLILTYRDGKLFVRIVSNEKLDASIILTDMSGRIILKERMDPSGMSEFSMDVVQGIYLVQVSDGKAMVSKKLFIN